jgi:hypothetical protein
MTGPPNRGGAGVPAPTSNNELDLELALQRTATVQLDIGFAEAFDMYRAAGWARSFPLPLREKDPPPVGITGRGGQAPDFQTVAAFRRSPWNSNLGVAMPQDLIGIDVDHYGDKEGARCLAELEERLGVQLAPTVRSTSRGPDNLSGIYLYRVPPGLDWKGEICPDVEIISWHDRYAVVWPSVHRDLGTLYRWYEDSGELLGRPPLVAGDHPDLPWQFIAHATKDPEVPADYEAPEPRRETVWHPKVLEAFSRFPGTGSLHGNARTASMILARYEQLQLAGATSALDELGTRFITTVEDKRERRGVAAEWGRLLTGARYKVRTTESTVLRDQAVGTLIIDPPPDVDADGVIPEPVKVNPDNEDTFWTARDELRHIRTYAQAQMACPLAVLAMVLARVVCQAPVAVVLPDIIHDHASLNLTIALVGISGGGKGGATGVARRAVDIGTEQFDTHTLGSGQGIAHGYGHWEKTTKRVERHADSVLFTVEEVDHLAGHNAQNGSTTLAEMRRFSMGEKLGHLYVDPTRRVQIPAHTYRGAIAVSVQPERGGVLLNAAAGGTPQRFWWVPTIDHDPPDVEPDRPTPWRWQAPSADDLPPVELFTGLRPIPVCEPARTAIRDAQRARNRGEGDPLDGHALLTRERIAAALGLLNGHWGINDQDWTLAGTLMAISDTTRAGVVATLQAKARTVNVARAHQEADRDEVKEDRQDQRVARRLLDYLRRQGDWVNGAELRRNGVTSRDRPAFESAIAKLVGAGVVQAEATTGPQGQRGFRYRVVEQ